MRKYYDRAISLAKSSTAKDTYILFAGNTLSAFLGFLFTLFVARAISVPEFGIFSAANNLIFLIISVTDLGISSGIVNFVSENLSKGRELKAKEYMKAAFVVRFLVVFVFSLLVLVFAPFVSQRLLASPNPVFSYWVALISLMMASLFFFPFVLQAKKQFLKSVTVDLSISITRTTITLLLFLTGTLTIFSALASFAAGTFVAIFVGFGFIGLSFLKAKPKKEIYSRLFRFSSWLGVNRVVSAVSGRLDIQMLAVLAGAAVTGIYSISSRLALFIVVLNSSFSSVLAPRLASFGNKEVEKTYIKKATLALLPIVGGIVLWIIIAEPFIVLFFGEKYLSAVPVFRALAAAMIPFLITAPSVTAIIYAMKKPVFIGTFSFFQLAAIFLLNLVFIPKYGPIGPTMTFGIVHIILAIYTWTIVIKHYWINK